MCTTNNSTKSAVRLQACAEQSSRPSQTKRRATATERRGRNCRIVESQRHKRHHSPRLDKNAAMCSKEIDVLIPPFSQQRRRWHALLDVAALGADRVDLQSLGHGEGVVGLAQRPVDGDDAVAVRDIPELAAGADRLGSQQTHGRALLVGVLGALRGTTASRNCLCTFTRRVDSLTATSTASRRCGLMKTPSPRPRHVQVHFLLRATDRVEQDRSHRSM